MDDTIEELVVDVRASTEGFASDIAEIRGSMDTTLVSGFGRAGDVLEAGLLRAVRSGALGFDDLKKTALRTLNEIAAQALQLGLDSILGANNGGGGSFGGLLNGVLGSIFGLPGRATGGPVSPGRGYLVGERGPELFVPTSSGQVQQTSTVAGTPRNLSVNIQVNQPRGANAPASLQRSSRQVASAVRRALTVN